MTITGKFNSATVYADSIEEEAVEQIKGLCDCDFYKDSKIRIMPDAHSGKGCVIGTTMTIWDKVTPNLVGVDISCGVMVRKLDVPASSIDFNALDTLIRRHVPSGFAKRERGCGLYMYYGEVPTDFCCPEIDIDDELLGIGTLGGGNHFIEVATDDNDGAYLIIHTGSRHLGLAIAKWYQSLAESKMKPGSTAGIIKRLKAEGKEREIERALKEAKTSAVSIDFAYLEGLDFLDYIHDSNMAGIFADVNRRAIADIICDGMGFSTVDEFTTRHNYINSSEMILRKGAVSAKKGEKFIVPLNMAYGSVICVGKGNAEWNFSAPHGAGRLMSRSKARKAIELSEFQDVMRANGVFTTCVSEGTIDESPMAYKDPAGVLGRLEETATVIRRIRPVYNFKADGAKRWK